MVYSGTKMCNMASRIQDMDAKDDADIIAIYLGTNDALDATVGGHALLGVESVIDKVKSNLNKPLIICSVPPTRNKYANSTHHMINDYLQFECSGTLSGTMTDIEGDGIHLKPMRKDKICRAILRASMDFPQTGKRAAT